MNGRDRDSSCMYIFICVCVCIHTRFRFLSIVFSDRVFRERGINYDEAYERGIDPLLSPYACFPSSVFQRSVDYLADVSCNEENRILSATPKSRTTRLSFGMISFFSFFFGGINLIGINGAWIDSIERKLIFEKKRGEKKGT